MKNRILLSFIILFLSFSAQAQELETTWAVNVTGGLTRPVVTQKENVPGFGNFQSGSFHLNAELYLPKKWNLEVGYFRDEVQYEIDKWNSSADRATEGINLQVKKYFIPRNFLLQPYLHGGFLFSWGKHSDRTSIPDIGKEVYTRNPVVTFAPGAGIELYVFSSVAFIADYSFCMGIDSRTQIHGMTADGPFYLADKGMYHRVNMGVKLTFPFKFKKRDSYSLINILMGQTAGALIPGASEKIQNGRTEKFPDL